MNNKQLISKETFKNINDYIKKHIEKPQKPLNKAPNSNREDESKGNYHFNLNQSKELT